VGSACVVIVQARPPDDTAESQGAHEPPHAAARFVNAFAAHLLPHFVGAIRAVLFAPDARDDGLQYLVADRPRRALRRIGLFGFPPEVGRGGDRHHAADRLDPIRRTMLVDERHHHWSSTADRR
jgi:hypothetical protein